MDSKVTLEETGLSGNNEFYYVTLLDEDGNKVQEELPTYNLTGREGLRADVRAGENGTFIINLLDRRIDEFTQMRILLAGVKNQEISFPRIISYNSEREFTVDISELEQKLEYKRNKSARILLETVEDGQYHRYKLMDRQKAKTNKDLKQGKRKWLYTQACSEKIYLRNEEEDSEIPYVLSVYMDKKGRWFIGLSNIYRTARMSSVCHLRYLTMHNHKLTLKLVMDTDRDGFELDEIVLRFRSKLQEERSEYRLTVKNDKIKKGMRYVTAEIDLNTMDLKSLYWDPIVKYINRDTGGVYTSFISMSRKYRLYTAFLYNGKFRDKNGFFMYPYNTSAKELAFQYREEGEFDHLPFRLKEAVAFLLYNLFKPYWNSRNIQLVYEKFCIMAQDNGYYFFKYCMDNNEEQRQNNHIYYVITKDAPDRTKLLPYEKNLVDYMSIRHMIYMQAARLLVSTDTRNHLYAMRQRGSILKRALRRKPLVFLQHGVTALKKVDFFYGKGKAGSCNLFVVTSDFEKKIVEDYFGYNEDEIVNSGFARWDVLEDKSEGIREILIMPTWRAWLENVTPEEFIKSDYFQNYMELLNSDRFHAFLEHNDLKANFYLHSKFREFIQDFSVQSDRIRLIAFGEEPANELMMRCKMLVTDYSSVCWDVFYLDKPVVFFQFDRDKYEEAHGSYLDMSKDLFGDCAEDTENLLNYMEKCAEQNFVIQPHYEKMRNNYFKYFDDQNSRRICDAIVHKWSDKNEDSISEMENE